MEAQQLDPTLAPNQTAPGQMEPVYQGIQSDQKISRIPQALAPGQEEEQKFRMAGATEDQISEYRTGEIEKLRANGATDPQIQDYYGIKEPDMSNLKDHFKGNLDAAVAAEAEKAKNSTAAVAPGKPQEARTFGEAWDHGWQMSIAGLVKRGKGPDVVLREDAGWAMQIVATIPQLAGDLPAMAAGWSSGALVGAPIGGLIGSAIPGAGTMAGIAAGYAIGGTGGAFAAPAAMREALMQHYERGDITSARDFSTRAVGVAWEGSKGFLTGLATEIVGGAANAKVLAATGKAILGDAARFAAELPTMVGVAKGLEGELPNRDDFLVAGTVLGGFHGARLVGPKLMSVFKDTGVKPGEVVDAARTNVELRQELVAQDSNIVPLEAPKPEAAPSLKEQAVSLATTAYRDAYQHGFDSIHPTSDISEQVYKVLDMQKSWKNKAMVMAKWETRDFENPTKITGEGLAPVVQDGLKAVKGQEISADGQKILDRMDPEISKREGGESKILSAYLVARSAMERAEKTPGKATGIDYDSASKFVDEHRAALEPIAKRFTEFSKRIVEYGRDAGLYDAKGVEAMQAVHENYAPLSRLMDEDPLTGQKPKGKGLQKFKGSERLILDPIQVQADNMNAIIRASEENRSRRLIADELRKLPEGDDRGRIAKPGTSSTQVQSAEVAKWIESHGLSGKSLPSEPFSVFRRGYQGYASNQIPFFEDGKLGVIELRKDIAAGVKSLDYQPGFSSLILRSAMAIGRASAQFAKKSITMSPAFAERNYFKDQMDKLVNDKPRELPFIPSVQALSHFFNEDAVWKNYLMSGGIGEGYYDFVDYHKMNFDKISEDQGIKDHIWNTVKNPLQAVRLWEHLLGGVEAAPRIAVAKSAGLMNGDFQSLLNAGFTANESTVNFKKVGLSTKAIAPLFKFLAPGMAGIERTTRGLADPEVWHRGFYAMTIPTVVNWMANRDDSRYQALPNYKLAQGWPILTNEWAPAANRQDFDSRMPDQRRIVNGEYQVNNGAIHFIPKPPGYGLIFATLPEAMLNSFYKQNAKAFKGFDNVIVDAFWPDTAVNVALPFYEKWANKNAFTGNPIVPEHMKGLLPALQWTTYTSETAKQLGKLIGASPLADEIGPDGVKIQSPLFVDTLIRDWTGPTGVAVTGLVDKALHAAGVGNQSPQPYSSLGENPFINGFTYRFPNARVQDVEDFYKRYSKNVGVVSSYAKSMRSGDVDEAQWIQDNYGENMVRLKYVNDALSGMNKTIQAVVLGKGDFAKMKGVEKRQLIDSTYYQMWQVAKEGNRQMDEFEKQIREKRGTRP